MYTPEFKLEVLSYYYTHGEQRRKTYEKFGISETNLRQWLKNYRIEKKKRIFAVGTGECIPNETPARYRQEAMRQRIEALEKALEYERMRCRGYEKLIEIAEKEEGVSILQVK